MAVQTVQNIQKKIKTISFSACFAICAQLFPAKSYAIVTGQFNTSQDSIIVVDYILKMNAHPSQTYSSISTEGGGQAVSYIFPQDPSFQYILPDFGSTEGHGTTSQHGFSVLWTALDGNSIARYTITPFAKIFPGGYPGCVDCGPVSASTSISVADTRGVIFDDDGFVPINNSATAFAAGNEVPAPLPLLGLGAALGYSRKLRKRFKSSKPEVISTTAV